MMRLVLALLGMLLLALGMTGWRNAQLSEQLHEAQRISAALSDRLASRDQIITRLTAQAQASSQREAALRHQLSQASHLVLNREVQIARETHASQRLREWSATALPDDLIRLHSRPAFNNARDYLGWLSAREQLSAAGQQPANAGRSGGR
ncbi:LysB family phage lysis regulatory protein [Pantoea sp. KPR_PJ]